MSPATVRMLTHVIAMRMLTHVIAVPQEIWNTGVQSRGTHTCQTVRAHHVHWVHASPATGSSGIWFLRRLQLSIVLRIPCTWEFIFFLLQDFLQDFLYVFGLRWFDYDLTSCRLLWVDPTRYLRFFKMQIKVFYHIWRFVQIFFLSLSLSLLFLELPLCVHRNTWCLMGLSCSVHLKHFFLSVPQIRSFWSTRLQVRWFFLLPTSILVIVFFNSGISIFFIIPISL